MMSKICDLNLIKKMEGNDYFILIDNVTHYNYLKVS